MDNIKNNKVFVTGCTKGIGKSICKKFHSNGFIVIGTGTKKLKKIPSFVDQYFNFNFLNEKEINNCCKIIKKIKPNILINNAGINIKNKAENITYKEFNNIIRVNLISPFMFSKSAINSMKKNKWGRIINIASIWSKTSITERISYSSSKFGLHGMTLGLAKELGEYSILVNSVSPGFVNTQLTKKNLKGKEKIKLINQVPLKRLAEVDEITNLIFWLASMENTYLTGENISIDGGFQ